VLRARTAGRTPVLPAVRRGHAAADTHPGVLDFPEALVQWEDVAKHKAFTLLERYRERVLSFDDDIQGTGAVALACLMTAGRITQTCLADKRVRIAGMGPAGGGIAQYIQAQMRSEGLTDEEIRRRIFALDEPDLLLDDETDEAVIARAQCEPRYAPYRPGRSS